MCKKGAKGALFWTSYSDLMTTLCFVMLVLFIVVTIAMGRIVQNNKDVIDELKYLRAQKDSIEIMKERIEKMQNTILADRKKVEKIEQIEKSIQNIDNDWFEYKAKYKKHMLKIDVTFESMKSDITNIPIETREDLYQAGLAIERFLNKADAEFGKTVEYLLIIEGQASKDNYDRNFELSYERALALYKYLRDNRGLDLKRDNCEVLISGSGTQGTMRALPDNGSNKTNQRFLIHILPKPGVIQ